LKQVSFIYLFEEIAKSHPDIILMFCNIYFLKSYIEIIILLFLIMDFDWTRLRDEAFSVTILVLSNWYFHFIRLVFLKGKHFIMHYYCFLQLLLLLFSIQFDFITNFVHSNLFNFILLHLFPLIKFINFINFTHITQLLRWLISAKVFTLDRWLSQIFNGQNI
jgi:dolichyl-phosphate-mannose--protein O-mannosyl transferase